MKRILLVAATIAAAIVPQAHAANVGVSVDIGHPAFYGRLDIGGFPAPPLLFPQPLIIERGPVGRPPLYLRVPPGHANNWRYYCRRYNACGEQVYFVRDDWYTREYAPRYREEHGGYREDRREYRREERRDERHDRHEYRGNERYDERGDRGGDWGHGHGRRE